MRTTIDLDDALLKTLRDEAHRQGISFRTLLHRVIHRGMEKPNVRREVAYKAPWHFLGRVREGVDLVKAVSLVSALEDEQAIRALGARR